MIHGERQQNGGAYFQRVVHHHRPFGDTAGRQDYALRRIQDGLKPVDAGIAEVRQGRTASLHLRQAKFSGLGFLGQGLALARQVEKTQRIRILNHRHQQSLGRLGGETDINRVPNLDGIFVPIRVDLWMVFQAQGQGPQE
jgi:hypothetical protein